MRVPAQGTVEGWAHEYIVATTLAHKLAPPPVPRCWEVDPPARRVSAPGRPPELRVVARAPRRPASLKAAANRAQLIQLFLHHELQAAELMCFALLAFPETPRAFRRGLLAIALDEVRHMGLYAQHLGRLGFAVGDFPVRDWFWQRVPACATPLSFVSVMGMGFEAGNLDHACQFADRFEAAGDLEGAALQRQVGAEEIAHVRFAVRWFERWSGGQRFEAWERALPAPLSPWLMRGAPMNVDARRRARMGEPFLAQLAAFQPSPTGPGAGGSMALDGAQPESHGE